MDEQKVKKDRKPKGLRKDKRIQVTYTDGKREDGKPNRIPFYGKTRSEAEQKRKEYIGEKEIGLLPAEKNTTLNEWIDRWAETYKVNLEDYGPYIARLKKDLGKMPIRAVNEMHLVKSLSAYSGKSVSAATKYRMIIRQIFRRARKNKLIPDDPADDLQLPSDTHSGSHRALEEWESESILASWRIHRAGRWAMIMMLCGLRRGEMIALDWSAVDLKKRTLTVRAAARLKKNQPEIKKRTKTDAGMRVLPICEPLHAMLMETPESERKGPVCMSANGKRISQSAMDRGWETLCNILTRLANGEEPDQRGRRKDCEGDKFKENQEAEQKKKERIIFLCKPHDLRHTYATALYDAGVDIKSAQYYLGHDDISMTQDLYTHLSKKRENASRSTLIGYLDKWLENSTKEDKKS